MSKVMTMSVDSSTATSERNLGMRRGGGDVSSPFHDRWKRGRKSSDSNEARLLTWDVLIQHRGCSRYSSK